MVKSLYLTLSYSSECCPTLSVCNVHGSESSSQKCLHITIPGFPYNIVWRDLLLKIHRTTVGLDIRPSGPLQAILLGDLVGCSSLLHIIMAIWCGFLYLESPNGVEGTLSKNQRDGI